MMETAVFSPLIAVALEIDNLGNKKYSFCDLIGGSIVGFIPNSNVERPLLEFSLCSTKDGTLLTTHIEYTGCKLMLWNIDTGLGMLIERTANWNSCKIAVDHTGKKCLFGPTIIDLDTQIKTGTLGDCGEDIGFAEVCFTFDDAFVVGHNGSRIFIWDARAVTLWEC